MTQMQQAPQDVIEKFLPMIFENEAKGILSDLQFQPVISMQFMCFTESETKLAIEYVVGVLLECYRAGHLKVVVSHEDDRLYGYAMFFVHPDPSISRYCHKIYVFEQYRGNGIGSRLLDGVLQDSQSTSLLCGHNLIPFYEQAGMEYKGDFSPPAASEGFSLTRGMYSGLALMGKSDANGAAPVFMLNDSDVNKIINLIGTNS